MFTDTKYCKKALMHTPRLSRDIEIIMMKYVMTTFL